jgi:hypothetical protein
MKRITTSRWGAVAAAGLLAFGLVSIAQGVGDAVDASVVVDGNPTCEGFDFGTKIEDPSGTYTIDRDGLVMTLTIGTYPDVAEPNTDNAIISFTIAPESDVTAGQIIVKGGPAATVYGFDDETPLHSPTLRNGKWPTISHVQICWDEPEPEPEYGTVDITKVVTGDGAPTDAEFEICITGPDPDTTEQCRTVFADGHAVFEQLEPGAYTVTETDPGTDWTVEIDDPTIDVIADTTTVGTITNTYVLQEQEPPVTTTTVPTTTTTIAGSGGTVTTTTTPGGLPSTGGGLDPIGLAATLLGAGMLLVRFGRRPIGTPG